MKLIVKQMEPELKVPHKNTIGEAFKWWLSNQNRHCKSFCVFCPYFLKCQEDVAREKYIGG